MHFRTLSYTYLLQSKAPTRHTLLTECVTSSCLLTRTCCPLAISTSGTGHQHPLCSALTTSEKGILTGAVNPSYPLYLSGIFHCPCFCSGLFSSFFEKLLKRGVSIHWLSFLTSHSILNPQQSDFTSRFPLPVTIAVDSRKTSMKSSILFRNLFF